MTQETPPFSLPEDDFDRGKALAWAMYDWADSAFATTVMAGFFPLFFKQYWSTDVAATTWGYSINQPWELYALAAAIGLVQGGIQSLSRSFYARLIPAEQSGEFFGLYNMLGKCAAVIGPVLMGWVSLMTGSPRTSILSLLVLFIGGALLLTMVHEEESRHPPETLDKGYGHRSSNG